MVSSIYIVGDAAWIAAIRAHQVPPRCRNVREGAGCIDWLEPDEVGKSWDEALKGRPKGGGE